MLETFTLKQHLDITRKELTQALYQHDAACRVIARLIQERDEARSLLSSRLGVQPPQGQVHHTTTMDVETSTAVAASGDNDSQGISTAVIAILNKKCEELSSHRKSRKGTTIPGLASKEEITGMNTKPTVSYTPHKTDKPGVTCIATIPIPSGDASSHDIPYNRLLTGGMDKTALLLNSADGVILSKLVGHTKKVNQVAFHPGYTHNHSLYTLV